MKKLFAITLLACTMIFTSCTGSTGSGTDGSKAQQADGQESTDSEGQQAAGQESTDAAGLESEEASTDPVDFQKIRLSENYCTAEDFIYEAEADEEGVWLRSWVGYADDEETPEYDIAYLADETVRQQIMQMLGDCNVASWDGFSESDPDVSDGSSFHLEIVLTDGTAISAYGSNAFPKNFRIFESGLMDLIEAGGE